ncbi:MAG: PorT family protein [Chitinophagaceae bacterium]|nr:PorT family protein [Chitinophagaceae bacterium]
MKLKAVVLVLISISVSHIISAQVQWGVKAGGNLSGMLLKDEGGYVKIKLRPGFHLGGTAELALADKFSLQPSLLLTSKGFTIDKSGGAQYLYGVDRIKFTSYYIELPVNFIFKPQAGNGKMLLGAGPYFAYGLGGRWKAEANGMSVTGKLKFINDFSSADSSIGGNSRTVPYTKPFDFGANILIGYEFSKNLYIHLNGQLGLLDVDMSYDGVSDETSSLKTVQGGLSIGYRF